MFADGGLSGDQRLFHSVVVAEIRYSLNMCVQLDLPHYFLADLPFGAEITHSMLSDACDTLIRNGENYLPEWTTEKLISMFDQLGHDWLNANFPHRKYALDQGPEVTGFSRQTLANGLDALFETLNRESLEELIIQDLGELNRLDGFADSRSGSRTRHAALARGPELIAQIAAGSIPNATILMIVFGMLARSAQLVKCASGSTFLPRLFAHSLYEVAPKLGACLEIVEWRGGDKHLESVLFEKSDCVIASGSDETLTAIRQRLPGRGRFLGYGHRVSFGYVTVESLASSRLSDLAGRAAADVVAWNQLGCLSPHVFYVEHGGRVSAVQFAEALAGELEKLEQSEPRGPLPTDQASTIATRRSFYELRASNSPETVLWSSPESTSWTVVYEADPLFQVSCLNRFVYVKGVTGLKQAIEGADAVRKNISTVGLASTGPRAESIALEFANWGATRICAIGQMQKPPLTWRHDGRPSLGDLVTWTDWER
ncbi:MAG: hypothetical protein O2960_11140 [Verrucomicrobia bacterium]|nr:hypothetical protein [Verrucomicrobiota bacterium]